MVDTPTSSNIINPYTGAEEQIEFPYAKGLTRHDIYTEKPQFLYPGYTGEIQEEMSKEQPASVMFPCGCGNNGAPLWWPQGPNAPPANTCPPGGVCTAETPKKTFSSGGTSKEGWGKTNIGCQPVASWDSELMGHNVQVNIKLPGHPVLEAMELTPQPEHPSHNTGKTPWVYQGSWYTPDWVTPNPEKVWWGEDTPPDFHIHATLTCRTTLATAGTGNYMMVWSLEVGDGAAQGIYGYKYIRDPQDVGTPGQLFVSLNKMGGPTRVMWAPDNSYDGPKEVVGSAPAPVVEEWPEYRWLTKNTAGTVPVYVPGTLANGSWVPTGRKAYIDLWPTCPFRYPGVRCFETSNFFLQEGDDHCTYDRAVKYPANVACDKTTTYTRSWFTEEWAGTPAVDSPDAGPGLLNPIDGEDFTPATPYSPTSDV